ncbi:MULTISPECIES: HNH endonuclease [Sphingomonas]|nr:HNH endonuclease [Sphingomonas sp. CGMCC 1.13658]
MANAVRRHVAKTGSPVFTRQSLIESELDAMVAETGSAGATPYQTLSRELQQLRDAGAIEFIDQGTYRWLGLPFETLRQGTSKGVFVIGSHSIYEDEPERFYRFPTRWMANAAKVVGNWIIYQEPRRAGRRGYYAVAKVERIVPDPATEGMYLALIEPGSYLEFGRDVPFQLDGQAVESGLLSPDGRLNNGRAIQSIRPISDADFNRIVGLGLIEEDELLPRVDEDNPVPALVQEEPAPWLGPVDRATMLVNRTVRNRQFRKRVLDVYDCRCALTGMKLINGGGRAETQAAHIMSVEAGGPDVVTNGIALSGTVHWMFDRGLISLSDDGEILLSRKINDIEGAEKIIYADRRARLPSSSAHRPHSRYLAWHRTECFHT